MIGAQFRLSRGTLIMIVKMVGLSAFILIPFPPHLHVHLEGISFELSARAERIQLPADTYFPLLSHFQTRFPHKTLHSHIAQAPSTQSVPFFPQATVFDYAIVHNERYKASSRAANNTESLVAVQTGPTSLWVGELNTILSVSQPSSVGSHCLGKMRWFVPAEVNVSDTVGEELFVFHDSLAVMYT